MKKQLTALTLTSALVLTGINAAHAVEAKKEENKTNQTAEKQKSGWVAYDGNAGNATNSAYYYKDGKKVTGWQVIDGKKYYFGDDGILRVGWQKIESKDKNGNKIETWYYLDEMTRQPITGWHYFDGPFINTNRRVGQGILEVKIIGSEDWYYFDSNGMWIKDRDKKEINGWQSRDMDIAYKLYYKDGKELTGWQVIDGKKYYFNKNGLLKRSWLSLEEVDQNKKNVTNWYYLEDNNYTPVTGWQYINERNKYNVDYLANDRKAEDEGAMHWYYFNKNNVMQTGWLKDGNAWYYLNKDGIMQENAWVGDYYVKANGKMAASEWIFDKNYDSWYYLKSDGSYARNMWQGNYHLEANGKMAMNKWIFDKNYNAHYYLKNDGSYARNEWVDNNRYYVDASGKWVPNKKHQNGWIKENGTWYYYKNDNKVMNTWIGSYYLGNDGKMVTNQWIFDKNYNSWYYLKDNGMYAKNEWIGAYYLKADGKMAKNEWIFDKNYNSWYYLKDNGSYARDEMVGEYYLKANGKMAKNETIYGKTFGENGKILSKKPSDIFTKEELAMFKKEGARYQMYYKNLHILNSYELDKDGNLDVYGKTITLEELKNNDELISKVPALEKKYDAEYKGDNVEMLEPMVTNENGKIVVYKYYIIRDKNVEYVSGKRVRVNLLTGEKTEDLIK